MPDFRGNDFEIQLPADYSDESTYAFALPARVDFRPSVVVKAERLAKPVELSTYAAEQLEKIQGLLPRVALIEAGHAVHGEFAAYTSVYDWGEPARRVRQKQRYILLDDPARVVTLTATNLRDHFAEAEALFDAIFLSFRPAGS
jgi:hypothetical protein